MNPGTILASLIAVGTLTGAILHDARKPTLGASASSLVSTLQREIEVLKAENNTLKSMQETTGEISIPLEFYAFVEKNLSMSFPSHHKVIKTDQDILVEAAEYRWIEHFKSGGINNRQYVFELLGIIPLNSQNYVQNIVELETNPDTGRLGVYDVHAKELLLSKDFNINETAHQVELVRLLCIALLESNYPADKNLTDDAFATRDSIIRGRAEMVAYRFLNIKTTEANPSLSIRIPQQTNELTKTLKLFNVVQGRSYIEQLTTKQREVFPELYQYIPQQSAFIFLNTPFIKQSPKPKAETPYDANKRILLVTELGQIYTKALITNMSDQYPNLHIELAYDQLSFIQHSDQPEAPILEWKINWTGEEPAKIFTTLFNQKNEYTQATRLLR